MAARYRLLVLGLLALLVFSLLPGCRPRATPTPAVPSPTASPAPTTPPPTATPAVPSPTPTPEKGFYRNPTYGFSLSFPPEWDKEETGQQNPVLRITGPGKTPQIRVLLDYLSQAITPQEQAQQLLEQLKAAVPEFALVGEGKLGEGYALEFSFTTAGQPGKARILLVTRGTQLFEVDALALRDAYDRNRGSLETALASFRLEEPQPFGIPRRDALTLSDTGPLTLDPALSQESRSQTYVVQIFSGLVTQDARLNLVPDIAERWEVSPDGRTYTFQLRRGVKFHSGREVKASDFKYSWERASSPSTRSQTAGTYLNDIVGFQETYQGKRPDISGVEVAGDYTLRVTIDAPKAYFLAKLTYPVAFVVDRENVEKGKEWWRQPNGTGPFQLQEWKPDQLLILKRNPLYYGPAPKIGYAIFRLFGGIPLRMYETGEIDAAEAGVDDLERAQDATNPLSKELKVIPQMSLAYIGFNATKPPFDDPQARRAFALAVDMDKIIQRVLKGSVTPARGILPPGMPGYNPSLKGRFDPQQAKELLASSRYAGKLPPITITTGGEGGGIPDYLAALLQEWKQNLGVEVKIRQLSPEVFFSRLKEEKDQMFEIGWIADYPDPHNFLDVLFHSTSEQNYGDYSSPDMDKLLEAARVERDPQKRLKMYQEIELKLLDEAPVVPLWFSTSYLLVKPYVSGYTLSPLGIPTLKDTVLGTR